jgi:hypothetical protein
MKVNIYSPIYHRYKKTRLCIENLIKCIDICENDICLYLGINGLENEEMKKWIFSLKSDKVKVFQSDINCGKAYIVNHMHENTRDADYMISIDSDMLDENETNWIDDLVNCKHLFEGFGVLSCYQLGNNCHMLDIQDKRITRHNYEILFGNFNGVAGGCFIMKNQDFLDIGRYTVFDIYNADDHFVMRKCVEMLRKKVGILTNIKLKHIENYPEEEDYQKWKVDKAHGQLSNGLDTKGFWD